MSALNSTTKPRCRGCRTGFFCPGDGTEKPCGEGSPTEFSFGAAANCSACPEGWVGEVIFSVIGELFGIQKVWWSFAHKNQERQSQNENKKMYNKRNNMNVYTFLVMLRLMFHRNFLIVKLCTFTDAKFPRPCFFFFFSSFSSVRMALRYLVQRVHMLSAMKRLVLTLVLE